MCGLVRDVFCDFFFDDFDKNELSERVLTSTLKELKPKGEK